MICNNSLASTFSLHSRGPSFNPPSNMPKISLEIRAHVTALYNEQQNCCIIAKKLGTIRGNPHYRELA